MRAPNITVIYYSRNGTVHELAAAAADGASAFGAAVRLLRVEDDGSHRVSPATAGLRQVPVAALDDLAWADGLLFATPTYYGNVSYPLKRFIDSTSPLWREGALADRVVAGMTTSNSRHGGRETTLLALYQSMYHWGALIMPAGQLDAALAGSGSNPYGVCAPSAADGAVSDTGLRAARTLGLRLCDVTQRSVSPAPGDAAQPGDVRPRVAVIYCPSEESTHALAAALAAGARAEGAEVRIRLVGKPSAGRRGAGRRAAGLARAIPAASVTDVEWADALVFGAGARIGMMAPQLLEFIESCEPQRSAGRLAGKAATGFVTTAHQHSGSESALLAFYNAMHHWGCVIVPPGYTDPAFAAAGGNPYGISYATDAGPTPDRAATDAALAQGRRLARTAGRLRMRPPTPGPAALRPPVSATAVR
ncbi:MAG: flavodoxin family protein [Catenulispora sp.]